MNWKVGTNKDRETCNHLEVCCGDSGNISVLKIMTSFVLNITKTAT